MPCENNENHKDESYCKSCYTCHDCVTEYQNSLESKNIELTKENSLLQAKLYAYELYEGRIDTANHKSHNSRIEDADEELQETLRELEELS